MTAAPLDLREQKAWTVAVGTWLLSVAALLALGYQAEQSGVLAISSKWQAALTLGTAALVVAGGVLALVRRGNDPPAGWIQAVSRSLQRLARNRPVSLVLIFAVSWVLPLLVFGPAGRYFEGILPRAFLFWVTILPVSGLLAVWFPASRWESRLLGSAVAYGVLIRALTFVPDLSTYPFSLGWSEASRYYYASLFRSVAVYGEALNPPELHPTRYLLQSIPFFFRGLSIGAHRLWQVLLWWLLPLGTAVFLVRRDRIDRAWARGLVAGWVVLYLLQGPVYYHLLVPVILILAGVSTRHPWRSTAFVLAASVWAGISRINWFPVPALLAGALWLLETPARTRGPRILTWPIGWFAGGTLAAFAAQALYVALSGIPPGQFTSSLTSPLLLYRLLPNSTYALGILPAVLLASAPLGLGLWWSRKDWLGSLGVWQHVFLWGSMAVLGVGGMLVSLKIGGGSNLHNLDAYLVLLLLVGSSLLLRASPPPVRIDGLSIPAFRTSALLVGVPVVFALAASGPWMRRDVSQIDRSLAVIRDLAQETARSGKAVLFISQRQLLTFGQISGVPVVPEYETVTLMEMAMAGNRAYLDEFHDRLRQHAFGLIVVDPLTTVLQGRDHNFGEENDAWVREVSEPILCWYEPIQTLRAPRVELLVPRRSTTDCDGGEG